MRSRQKILHFSIKKEKKRNKKCYPVLEYIYNIIDNILKLYSL